MRAPSAIPTTGSMPKSDHQSLRVDLAAAFRWFARLDMHEAVANHFSVATSSDGLKFLINPRGVHFSRVTASSLLLLDAQDRGVLERPDAPDPTAWHLHARLHARVPQARCIMHLHPKYSTALACLEDPTLYPVDMNAMRFFGRVAVDPNFAGMALSDGEGDRIADLVGPTKTVVLMANHGVIVFGPTVAAAFDELYYFERAARTLMTAYATGRPLRRVPDAVAALTERQWREYEQSAVDHLEAVKAILTDEGSTFRD